MRSKKSENNLNLQSSNPAIQCESSHANLTHQSRQLILLLSLLLIGFVSPSFADEDEIECNVSAANPELPGPYKIGYRQIQVANNAASAKASPADANGRVLELSIWYPIDNAVAATGIPLRYDESRGSVLNYGIPPAHLSHRPLLDVRVDQSSIMPLTLTGPNIPACDDPLGTLCSHSSIVGLPVAQKGAPFPVLAFSHGSPVSQKNNTRLHEHLASYGYIVVAPRHAGNSTPDGTLYFLTGGATCGILPFRPCSDSGSIPALNRPQDVSFALDKLFDGSLGADLKAAANLHQVGAFGWSVGGHTTLILAGGLQTATGSFVPGDLTDSRIRAAVALSPTLTEINPGTAIGPPLILPNPALSAVDIPMAIMVGEHEKNVNGVDYSAKAREIFHNLKTEKTGVKYRILAKNAVHSSFSNNCAEDFLEGIKLGNTNPSGADFTSLAIGFLVDWAIPSYPAVLTGKTDAGYQAYCRNSFFYEPSNRGIWDAFIIPPGFSLGSLLLNNPPLSIPLDNLPGFIDPVTFQFVPTRTSDEVQKTTNGYLVSFFNTYLKGEMQYKRFLKGEAGKTEVEVCKQAEGKENCKIVERES